MNIEIIPVGTLTSTECKRYKSLTMRKGGDMCKDFNLAREEHPTSAYVLAIKGSDKYTIRAWALVFPSYRGRYDFEVYTRVSERRKGLGNALYQQALILAGGRDKLVVHPWDRTSSAFFRKMHIIHSKAKDYK